MADRSKSGCLLTEGVVKGDDLSSNLAMLSNNSSSNSTETCSGDTKIGPSQDSDSVGRESVSSMFRRRNSLSAILIPSATSALLSTDRPHATASLDRHHPPPSSNNLLDDVDSFTNPRSAPAFPPRPSVALLDSSASTPSIFSRSHSYDSAASGAGFTSFHRPASSHHSYTAASARPQSSGTYSSNTTSSGSSSSSGLGGSLSAGTSNYSTRPWVRDSDASSICSAGSSGWSGGNLDDGLKWVDEGGEVYRVGADGTECELASYHFHCL